MNTENTITTNSSLIARESIESIVGSIPQVHNENSTSAERCIKFGALLKEKVALYGMSDELDQQLANYIAKSRNTVKLMNEKRSGFTRLLDKIKGEFTSLENMIDPAKAGTLPYELQQERNKYAAKKREEEERKRREAEMKARKEQVLNKYLLDCEENFRMQVNRHISQAINHLEQISDSLTVENANEVKNKILSVETTCLSIEAGLIPTIRAPFELEEDEIDHIRNTAYRNTYSSLREQYETEVGDFKAELLDKLPSRIAVLQQIAKMDAEEQERLKKQIAEREAEEAAKREEERIERERREREAAELKKASTEIGGLFDVAAASNEYKPKTKVTKKIQIIAPDGIVQVISLWWQVEGCNLSIEELTKMFKKQITVCEKQAKEGNFIKHPAITYIDEVKAR